jgi:glycosyltransferase involved in cell wall biosynthesis
MKLLFAIKKLASAVGGAERVLCTLCTELAERGHDVAIVTFDRPGGLPFYPLDERVRCIDLGIGDSARPTSAAEMWRRIRALRRVALTECPDMAVGFMHSMFVPLAFSLAGTQIPVLGSEHIVPEHYRRRPFQYVLFLAAAPFLARVTVLSEAIRVRYPGLLRRRMVAMPNPVASASEMVEGGGAKARFVLLCVGRLDEQKDHATLLRAFALIAPKFPGWQLRIVGEGPLRPDLEQLIDTLGLRTRVTMPGVTAAIGEEYQLAEAFVISSRYEAFGLVTAEAMSHGLPVVGFADCPGTNELIEAERTGLLVDPGTNRAESLARALSRLLEDPVLRCRLGTSARQAIGEQFSPRHVCDLWERLLLSVGGTDSSPPVPGDGAH